MNRLAGALAIRPGEGRIVVIVAIAFAAVEAGRGLGEVAVQALILDSAGPSILPSLYIALGLVGLTATLTYGALIGRSRGTLFPRSLLAFAAVIGAEGLAVILVEDVPLFALAWVSVFTGSALLTTVLWTVAGRIFDTRQAKRLFPLCTAATIGGSCIGLLAAGPISQLMGVEPLLIGQALLIAVGGFAFLQIQSRLDLPVRRGESTVESRSLRDGASYVARSPLMRLVAIAYVLFALLLFSMAFPFSGAMAEAFPDRADLATALGLLAAAVTAVSFLLATLVANRVYARFGVTTIALLLPLVYVAGFGVWLVAFTIGTAIGVKFAQEVTQRGLSNAVWSALFTVVPASRRGQVLAFIDGVPGQLGTVLTGVLLLVVAALGAGTAISVPLFALGAAAALACLWVVILIRRRYPAALLATLRENVGERVMEGGPGLAALARHPGMPAQLRECLGSDRASDRKLAIELVDRLAVPGSTDDLVPLIDDPDPAVRRAALAVLGRHGNASAIDQLLRSEHVNDRVAGLHLIAKAGGEESLAHLDDALNAAEPDVRAAALAGIASLDGPPSDRWDDRLVTALGDDSSVVRAAAAQAVVDRPALTPQVLNMLPSSSGAVQDGVLASLDGDAALVQDALVPWAEAQVDRAAALRRYAATLGSATGDSAAYLADLLRRRSLAIEGRLLRVLAILGSPEAVGPIRRCLRSNDPETRAQAIEALDALGSSALGRSVVRLIDSEPGAGPTEQPAVLLSKLREDADPWVRALATRMHDELRDGGSAMPEDRTTLDEIDRMLLLRRVPLFSVLEPEDLQRVAATARERTFAAGEALVRQGEVGEELIVIVDGTVGVLQAVNGADRFIRRYGAGDHIGELAVLRERERVATVVAEEPGVSGLVLDGTAVRAILRERPDAAMALLATLAERIGIQ